MANIVVEHKWKDEDGEKVMKTVEGIIDMKHSGSLPSGFNLLSINVIGQENRAICNWEAPSSDAMSELLGQVNPPTTHNVYQAERVL